MLGDITCIFDICYILYVKYCNIMNFIILYNNICMLNLAYMFYSSYI